MRIESYAVVMLGGAIGSALRFGLTSLLTVRYGETFPLGTLAANVIGSFAIGLYGGLAGPSLLARQFVMIGILGGFTTFSSFSLQTCELLTGGAWARAILNVFLSVALCLGGTALGMVAARAINLS